MLCRALGTKYIHFTVPAVHSHRIHSAGLNLRSRSRFHAHAHARTRAPSICLSVWLLLLLQALLAPAILSVCGAFCSLLLLLLGHVPRQSHSCIRLQLPFLNLNSVIFLCCTLPAFCKLRRFLVHRLFRARQARFPLFHSWV